MTDQCVSAFQRYVQVRGEGSPDDQILLSNRGKTLYAPSFQAQVREIAERANVEDASCHRFRHSFATSMLANGCPLEVLAELMGHSTLDITRLYAKIAPTKSFEAYKKADIRNRLSCDVALPQERIRPPKRIRAIL